MAAKRGADIPTSDFESIAVYLASRNSAATGGGSNGQAGAAGGEGDKTAAAGAGSEASSLSTFLTVSPQWRGGNDHLQNPGFGPLAWFGASWQGQIVSGRATACIACHGVAEPGFINRIEPVEAAVRIDLSQFLDKVHARAERQSSTPAGSSCHSAPFRLSPIRACTARSQRR